jgi:hypothetical protein
MSNLRRILIILCAAMFGGQVHAFCDAQLKPGLDAATAYKLRSADARCEGVYQQAAMPSSLELVGLLWHPLIFELGKDKALQVSAPKLKKNVLIRAEGIPLRSYYRMDAVLAPESVFHWPLDVLAQIKIAAANIGVFGRLQENPEIYVPLRVVPVSVAESEIAPVLLLRANENLSIVNWRHAEAEQGQCGKMRAWMTLDAPRGFRSGQVIPVPLPEVTSPQLCIEVVAQPRFGKDWLQQLWRIQIGD